MRGFYALSGRAPWPTGTPVLYRAVPYPAFGGFRRPQDVLRAYPARVLYGGPTRAEYVQGAQGRVWREGMAFWALQHQLALADEIVAIVPNAWPPNSGAPRWPHTEWRWWYETEQSPVARYALRESRPDTFVWRPV